MANSSVNPNVITPNLLNTDSGPLSNLTQSPLAQSTQDLLAHSTQDPLAHLHDIHLPEAVSNTPAIGWWLLAGLAVLALVVLAIWLYRQHQKKAYRRQALKLIEEAVAQQSTTANAHQILTMLNQILKRTALYAFPSGYAFSSGSYNGLNIEQLHGKSWSAFLNDTLGKRQCAGSKNFGERLYQAKAEIDIHQAQQFANFWVKHHQAQNRQNAQADAQSEAHHV